MDHMLRVKKFVKRFSVLVFTLFAILASVFNANANVVMVKPLSFGKIAVISNSSVSSTSIRRNGSQTSTEKILVIEQGSPAVIQLSSFPIFNTISLTSNVPVSSTMPYSGSQQFTLAALDMPATIKVDGLGEAVLIIGGTLTTSGLGGTYYNEAVYDVYFEIEFSY